MTDEVAPPPRRRAARTEPAGTPAAPPPTPSWLPARPAAQVPAARAGTATTVLPSQNPPAAPETPAEAGLPTTTLPATALPATALPATALPTGDEPPRRTGTLHRVHRRGITRAIGVGSGLLGTVGILLGLVVAAVNLSKWPAASACLAYSQAHQGAGAFGCGVHSRLLALVLPPVGCLLLVLGALAVLWVPAHTNRRRGLLLVVWALLLVGVAGIEAAAYSALPG